MNQQTFKCRLIIIFVLNKQLFANRVLPMVSRNYVIIECFSNNYNRRNENHVNLYLLHIQCNEVGGKMLHRWVTSVSKSNEVTAYSIIFTLKANSQ